jgi:hypothetical protein
MNWDYPEVKTRFAISEYNGFKVFHMDFNIFDGFATTVGMNNKGLFTAVQMQYPPMPTVQKMNRNEIDMNDLAVNMLYGYENIDQIKEFLKNKNVVNHYLTIHDQFADKFGKAIVVESDDNETRISEIKNKFMVMTNFANSVLNTYDYSQIFQVGSDRYAKAFEYIEKNISKFDLNYAFQCLNNTAQTSGSYPTQTSIVFIPDKNEVYISLKRDFGKVWKVSIDNGTIATFKGFKNYFEKKIDKSGILMKELLKYSLNDKKHIVNKFPLPYILGIAAICVLIIVLAFVIRKKSRLKRRIGDNAETKQ